MSSYYLLPHLHFLPPNYCCFRFRGSRLHFAWAGSPRALLHGRPLDRLSMRPVRQYLVHQSSVFELKCSVFGMRLFHRDLLVDGQPTRQHVHSCHTWIGPHIRFRDACSAFVHSICWLDHCLGIKKAIGGIHGNVATHDLLPSVALNKLRACGIGSPGNLCPNWVDKFCVTIYI